jgi:hypothetical protein
MLQHNPCAVRSLIRDIQRVASLSAPAPAPAPNSSAVPFGRVALLWPG